MQNSRVPAGCLAACAVLLCPVLVSAADVQQRESSDPFANQVPALWALEVSLSIPKARTEHNAEYVDTLDRFGFEESGAEHWRPTVSVGLIFEVDEHFSAGLHYEYFDNRDYTRGAPLTHSLDIEYAYGWTCMGIGPTVRFGQRFFTNSMFYLDGGVGLAWATSVYDARVEREEVVPGFDPIHDRRSDVDLFLRGGVGVSLMMSNHFGFLFRLSYRHAAVLTNLLGEKHNSGGLAFDVGLRFGR